jgi:hypothetical protein
LIVILFIHRPRTPFNHLSPWTNFSTPLVAPSHPRTFGPWSPRRSVWFCKNLEVKAFWSLCHLCRMSGDCERRQRTRTTTITNNDNGEQRRRRTTMTTNNYDDDVDNKETWGGSNTTINISPLVVSWTLSAVQSFDVKRKRRHQTTTTPSETREGGQFKNTTINISPSVVSSVGSQRTMTTTRGWEQLIGINCTQTPINWNCGNGQYLELQYQRIANPRIEILWYCLLFTSRFAINWHILLFTSKNMSSTPRYHRPHYHCLLQFPPVHLPFAVSFSSAHLSGLP